MAETSRPSALPLDTFCQLSGLSRSFCYKLSSAGRLRLVKVATKTLVDLNSYEQLLRSAPEVTRKSSRRPIRRASDHGGRAA